MHYYNLACTHTLIPALRFRWMNSVIIPEKRNTSGFHGVRLCACLLSLSSGAADGVSGRCSQRRGTCVVTSFDLFLLCASLWTQTCPSSQLYGEALAAPHLRLLQRLSMDAGPLWAPLVALPRPLAIAPFGRVWQCSLDLWGFLSTRMKAFPDQCHSWPGAFRLIALLQNYSYLQFLKFITSSWSCGAL